jgi:hypothetical protein
MIYTCPVCAYGRMEDAPCDYNICPCCGTEFGYDDASRSHIELRETWLRGGGRWFSHFTEPPPLWNPVSQLAAADYDYDIAIEDPMSATTTIKVSPPAAFPMYAHASGGYH